MYITSFMHQVIMHSVTTTFTLNRNGAYIFLYMSMFLPPKSWCQKIMKNLRIHGPIKQRPKFDAGGLLVKDRSFAGADYVSGQAV